MTVLLTDARTLLFVPADRPERHAKALASGADAVIIDLEDAVAPAAKAAARQALAGGLAGHPAPDRQKLLVRINAQDTAWFDEDLAFIAALPEGSLGGLMVPKVEDPALLATIAAACPGLPLLPQIESGAGLDALDRIALGAGVARLCLGHLDLQNDLGISCGPDESEIAPARWELVRASRRHGLPPPVDSVTTDTRDKAATDHDAARALRQGFGGKLCIHPAQVAWVHAAFMPGAERQDWARRVLAAVEASRGGVCSVDGRMVDTPVIVTAQRVLARSRRTA